MAAGLKSRPVINDPPRYVIRRMASRTPRLHVRPSMARRRGRRCGPTLLTPIGVISTRWLSSRPRLQGRRSALRRRPTDCKKPFRLPRTPTSRVSRRAGCPCMAKICGTLPRTVRRIAQAWRCIYKIVFPRKTRRRTKDRHGSVFMPADMSIAPRPPRLRPDRRKRARTLGEASSLPELCLSYVRSRECMA